MSRGEVETKLNTFLKAMDRSYAKAVKNKANSLDDFFRLTAHDFSQTELIIREDSQESLTNDSNNDRNKLKDISDKTDGPEEYMQRSEKRRSSVPCTKSVMFAPELPEVKPPPVEEQMVVLKGNLKTRTPVDIHNHVHYELNPKQDSLSFVEVKDNHDDTNNNADWTDDISPNSYERHISKESDSVFLSDGDEESTDGKNHNCDVQSSTRNGLLVVLSGIYGILIVVLGLVLPIAEIFEGPEQTYFIEGYYLFLYLGSMVFMIYVYMYLMRSKEVKTKPSAIFGWLMTSASQASAVATPSPGKRRTRRISMDIRKNKQTGSFYLRLGAVGFGIGSMIHSGLQFGEYFQVYEGPAVCFGAIQAMKPITHLLFTFVQLYFIFSNAKMCINKFQIVARFGLMHMIGTNMCVWFRNIIVETLHEIHQHEMAHATTTPIPTTTTTSALIFKTTLGSNESGDRLDKRSAGFTKLIETQMTNMTHATNGDSQYHNLPEITCHFNDVMGRVVEQAGPYLYPCTIEYSLICAGILYVMWRNVGRDHSRHLPPAVDGEIGLYRHRMSVDCSNSSRGLFTGIFLFVFAVISIIAFFVLVQKDGMSYTAIIFVNLCEIITYTLGMVATVTAFHRMKTLSYVMRGGNLEDNLVLISLSGVYVFAIFSIIAATDDTEAEGGVFLIFADLFLMLQATLQTIFMLSGMRMYATKTVQEQDKPGREMVTFLLVSNIAMWGMTTFETQRSEHNPIQLHFYGYLSWSILTHISVPLAIFFRFHSTVCLSNIWKQAWKKRAALL